MAFRKTQRIIPKSLEKQDAERCSQAVWQSLRHEHSGYRYVGYRDLSCSEWKLVLDAIATFCTHSSGDQSICRQIESFLFAGCRLIPSHC